MEERGGGMLQNIDFPNSVKQKKEKTGQRSLMLLT